MQKLSVVIVCKNGAKVIEETIKSFSGLTDDILIYDNGSTDGTQEKVKGTEAKLFEGSWEGFGKTKNKANALAQHDWILSLDADEAIDDELKKNLVSLDLSNEMIVYEIRFKNFLGNKWLRFGEWGDDKHIRLFDRKKIQWNDAAVHERLLLPTGIQTKILKGHILHHTSNSIDDHINKTIAYAKLNAEKYSRQHKRAGFFKLRIAPGLTFFQHYILRLGFLDGWEGYFIAKTTAWYTFLKYSYLREMNKKTRLKV